MKKEIIKDRFPLVASYLKKVLFYKNWFKSETKIFTDYYKENYWNNEESRSGPGSDLSQTKKLIEDLPEIIRQFDCKSILDAPCGDFFWMNRVNLKGIDYLGVDIVEDLIVRNKKSYENDTIKFMHRNLLKDALPKVDLIFSRDVMVHLPNTNVIELIKNFKRSNSTYLLATNFSGNFKNIDIVTGDWRVIDLTIEPFNFPLPLFKYKEVSTLGDGKFPDKYLCLWKLEDISL